jgi:hypothetical protein
MTTALNDSLKWWPTIRVKKYDAGLLEEITHDFGLTREPNGLVLDYLERNHGVMPSRILDAEGNSLVNTGLQRVSDLIIGSGAQAFTTSRGMTGVGDSSTAFAVTQTTLVAGTNTLYKAIDSAPGSATGVITAQTTYQTGDANYAWNEWCLAIATAAPVSSSSFSTATTSGIMLNRKVQSLGTKVSTAVWVLQVTVTQA